MNAPKKRIVSASVREVVEFVLRTGGLAGSGQFSSPGRALQGTRAHIRHQKSKPAGYESEVTVARDIDAGDFVLQLRGRIDGLHEQDGTLLIEEIKTVHHLTDIPADPVHIGQAKLYGLLYGEDRGFTEVDVQVTYLELETMLTREVVERCTMAELRAFFDVVIGEYLQWLRDHAAWLRLRDASIAALQFPFGEYRAGQRSLAVAVYRTVKAGGKLFAEAPTGIGKTISVLFPAIKAQGEGHLEKIFYTTAKTIGRTVAENAIADLRAGGLRLRSVTLTAKDKICFNGGKPCDLAACPFAISYYDRIKDALRDALGGDNFTREAIETVAQKHQVCPFELSLDLSVWADVIICDYNYVFDPSVSLKRFFGEERREFAILVDEAHNLVDRAREMFSAELLKHDVKTLREALEGDLPACAKTLKKVQEQFTAFTKLEGTTERDGAFVNRTCPEKMPKLLKDFCTEAESWLVQNNAGSFHEQLLDFYFMALAFVQTAELFDERYMTCFEPQTDRLKLFCVDPSRLLQQILGQVRAAVFFSATLNPLEYYRESLGGELADAALTLDSPFPRENLLLMVQDRVATTLRARADSYGKLADAIAAVVSANAGNYLVYFPSYEYLTQVLKRFCAEFPEIGVIAQKSGMTEAEREEFLRQFEAEAGRTVVGFAVLGGIFGEGIDLVGDRLIGVVVVGIGLPQLCLERDLIREYWQNIGRPGFDYAYTFPGMNRVMQAVGRLIRTETDRGSALLIDERYGRSSQRGLFPAWWKAKVTRGEQEIEERCGAFWNDEAEKLGNSLALPQEC